MPFKINESRKPVMITPEQEELLNAFEQAKKIGYGEFTISIWQGGIARYKIKKSKSFFYSKKRREKYQGGDGGNERVGLSPG